MSTKEPDLENLIVLELTKRGYTEGNPSEYDPRTGLFKNDFLSFIKSSQEEAYQKYVEIKGNNADNHLVQRVTNQLDNLGVLPVLRTKFTDYGVEFKCAFFKPSTSLNPQSLENYQKNILKVYRQVHFSESNPKLSVDIVIALNGLPLFSIELKNQFTGQDVKDGKKQFEDTRKNCLLYAFNKRSLAHFSLDNDQVHMTTKLENGKTKWMPFNRGHNGGKGNPPVKDDCRSSYFWKEILAKDSLLEILQKFMLKEESRIIFPRYHQIDAIRKIIPAVLDGKNKFLIQHSAGSGKSNTLAWLSHRLSSLHKEDNSKVFDSVVIVTDRKILDNQLQEVIRQVDHTQGTVATINTNSKQLKDALVNGKNIIVTTLQKFPFVLKEGADLPERKYAIVIDEAHSSQGGSSAESMQTALAGGNQPTTVEEAVEQQAKSRSLDGLSLFAFTATPKAKTLALFGTEGLDGNNYPFHVYSMKQAIEEGFILDVLKNYVTYKSFYEIAKQSERDPEINKGKGKSALARFAAIHPQSVAQKTEIILEHFTTKVVSKIGGKARAMIVCSSRKAVVKYTEAFKREINKDIWKGRIDVISAFSGSVSIDEQTYTETGLNGFADSQVPAKFQTDPYRLLIVADKYQTGFDQPLLHTMYVDKSLNGIAAVQTLSRLNRTHPEKEDTFVLDFVNQHNDIRDAFEPFYQITSSLADLDFNALYDLKTPLDNMFVYYDEHIDALTKILFNPSIDTSKKPVINKLYGITDEALKNFYKLGPKDQRDFQSNLKKWIDTYVFFAQIAPFTDRNLEKFVAFAKLFVKRLPKSGEGEIVAIDGLLSLDLLRIELMQKGDIILEGQAEPLTLNVSSSNSQEPEKDHLSVILENFNESHGTDFTEKDKVTLNGMYSEFVKDSELVKQAQTNDRNTFKLGLLPQVKEKLFSNYDQQKMLFEKLTSNKDILALIVNDFTNRLYRELKSDSHGD